MVLVPGYALATLLVPRWLRLATPRRRPRALGRVPRRARARHAAGARPVRAARRCCRASRLLAARGARSPSRRTHRGRLRLPWWLPVPGADRRWCGRGDVRLGAVGPGAPARRGPTRHGTLAAAIARTHDVLRRCPEHLEGTAFAYARPGFEAMAAAVSWIGGPSPAHRWRRSSRWCLCCSPSGSRCSPSKPRGSIALAAVVPLVAVGMIFPSFEAILGRFPQVVDSTLVVPLIVAAIRVVRGATAARQRAAAGGRDRVHLGGPRPRGPHRAGRRRAAGCRCAFAPCADPAPGRRCCAPRPPRWRWPPGRPWSRC